MMIIAAVVVLRSVFMRGLIWTNLPWDSVCNCHRQGGLQRTAIFAPASICGGEVDADASYINYTVQRRTIAIHHLYHQILYHHYHHVCHFTIIIFNTIIVILSITIIIIIITGGLISSRQTSSPSSLSSSSSPAVSSPQDRQDIQALGNLLLSAQGARCQSSPLTYDLSVMFWRQNIGLDVFGGFENTKRCINNASNEVNP